MPSELRILRFKLDEVEIALRSLGPRIGLYVPGGAFSSAESAADNETPGTSFAVNGSDKTFSVSNGQLAASLIHFCQSGGMEFPREGKKEIYVSSDFVELRIGIRHPASGEVAEGGVEIEA